MENAEASTSKLFTKLVKQGAEAKAYQSNYYPTLPAFPPSTISSATISLQKSIHRQNSIPILIKHRFPKKYRHPSLDSSLTKSRLTSEVKCLIRAGKGKVNVPKIWFLDFELGVIGMEWIDGGSFRDWLGVAQDYDLVEEGEEGVVKGQKNVDEFERDELLSLIGKEIAKMHLIEIIHGDLTTSNIMLQPTTTTTPTLSGLEIVLIDFGLSTISSTPEDRAVDLYVLERAFTSTHPVSLLPPTKEFPQGKEGIPLFEQVLKGYEMEMKLNGAGLDSKGKLEGTEWDRIWKRLEEVRGRGRKRSMLG